MFNFLLETFVLGVRNLRLHKLRSLLTALGIIIGVLAVIVMVAIGEGAKRAALDQLQKLGQRNVVVRTIRPPESNEASQRTQRTLAFGLTRQDLARLQALPDLSAVVPMRDTEQRVTRGDQLAPSANAIGTTPDIFPVVNLQVARGTYFTPIQYERSEAVCVMGHTVARQLFPYEEPIGAAIRVGVSGSGTIMLTVVGVLEPSGLQAGSNGASMVGRDLDMNIYFPLSLAWEVFGDTSIRRLAGSMERKEIQLTDVWLQAEKMEDVEHLAALAENEMAKGLTRESRPDVKVEAPIQILRSAEETGRMFNLILVTIASFALVVGGIGIMNIMLATVTERTREIGIRRALGAKRRHITLQFLIETTVISLTGGVIGVAVGTFVSEILPRISDGRYPTEITSWSVI